MKIRPIGAE